MPAIFISNREAAADFIRTSATLTHRYGHSLTEQTSSPVYERFVDYSYSRQNRGLEYGLNIGRIATASRIVGQCRVNTRLSVLHEAVGMMPAEQKGQLLGAVAVDIARMSETKRGHPEILCVDWSFYTGGAVDLDVAQLESMHGAEGEIDEAMAVLDTLGLRTTIEASQDEMGDSFVAAIPMDSTQIVKLTNFLGSQILDTA